MAISDRQAGKRGGRDGFAWSAKRALPLLLFSLGAGAVTAFLRAVTGFFPGMQGVLYGALLGWLAGRWMRGDARWLKQPGERFWLWLNMLCCYLVALGLTLGALYAPPLSSPLNWLGAVAAGYAAEPFVGASMYNPQSGLLQGWGWLLLNLLDTAFLFVAGLIVFGVVADRQARGAKRAKASGAGPGRDRRARLLFLALWGVVLPMGLGLAVYRQGSVKPRHDEGSWARMQRLAGRYTFEDGRHLLGPVGQEGVFRVSLLARDGVLVRSEPEGVYGISLTGDGRNFRGTLQRGGSPVAVRARFSADGQRIIVSGPVFRQGIPAGEVAVEAHRSE